MQLFLNGLELGPENISLANQWIPSLLKFRDIEIFHFVESSDSELNLFSSYFPNCIQEITCTYFFMFVHVQRADGPSFANFSGKLSLFSVL